MAVSELEKNAENITKKNRVPNRTDTGMSSKKCKPQLLAVGIVLGIMGLFDIPLDLMTITIAAITMGIAIDNSIHYIYRFREEFSKNMNYPETIELCHRNIGRAIVNTSITIIFGFSILVLSNFIPTIYFGVLTGLAMLIAMLAILTLLPRLILIFKPF